MCSNCAENKAYDEELQRIYEDYLNTAESIKRPGCGTWFLVSIPSIVLSVILVSQLQLDPGSFSAACVSALAFLPVIVVITWLETKASIKVSQISKVKPGFAEFYKLWRKQKDRQELLTAAALGIAAVGAAAGAYQAYQRQQLYRDVHDIKEKL
ncbi:MAG: hypothetical protein QXZ09_07820 [Candidatus Methanomethylicaceae archaeon]